MFLVLQVFAANSFSAVKEEHPNLSGTWYHAAAGKYYHDTERKDISRWYKFSGNRVFFSTCTDMCGCMRVTKAGTYSWLDENTIEVVFTKSKREYAGGYQKLDEAIKENLKIVKLENGGFCIYSV